MQLGLGPLATFQQCICDGLCHQCTLGHVTREAPRPHLVSPFLAHEAQAAATRGREAPGLQVLKDAPEELRIQRQASGSCSLPEDLPEEQLFCSKEVQSSEVPPPLHLLQGGALTVPPHDYCRLSTVQMENFKYTSKEGE